MILKLLLVIGVIAIVYFMFIKKKPLESKPKSKTQKKKEQPQVDDMIECESCGVYVSIEESILSNGHYYCSRECVIKAQ